MKKKYACFICIMLTTSLCTYSQIDYSLKVETGLIQFIYNSLDVDPGPNWKGYYLEGQDGIDVNIINGIGYDDKFFAGVGLGYLNFEGMDGMSVFAGALPDFDAISLWSGFDSTIGVFFNLADSGKEIYSATFWYSHHAFLHRLFAGVLFSLLIASFSWFYESGLRGLSYRSFINLPYT